MWYAKIICTSANLTTKLLEDKSPTANDIKHLGDEINQAILEPQQVFSPLADNFN